MKSLSFGILAVVQLAGTWMAVAQTATDLGLSRQVPIIRANVEQTTGPSNDGTSAAITISTRNLDFGVVRIGNNNELSFKIQNVGARSLTGVANVSPPFRIIGRNAFVLEPAQTQVITVQYAPTSTGMHMTVVHLTGASVTVMGSAAPGASKGPARRRPQPDGQRLLARQ